MDQIDTKHQTIAVLNYEEFRKSIEETLWLKLKCEAEKLLAEKMYYSMGEVCKIFGKSAKTIERWNKIGKLCYSSVTEDGSKMFSIAEVEALHEILKMERERKYRGYF
jgi:hypothetical protein